VGRAEELPFDDEIFDAVFSQLALNFMSDPAAGVTEMRRVARPGGMIAACVWDYAGEMTLLRTFWNSVKTVDPASVGLDEGVTMPHCTPKDLAALWTGAGLRDVEVAVLMPSVRYSSFASLWQPFLAGVAPSGAYAAGLDERGRAALRDEFFHQLGSPIGPLVLTARAWAVVGTR
jgi:SAM-dependent methyltransferase